MTPYRERREAGHYDPNQPKKTVAEKSTTSSDLTGLGTPAATDEKPKTASKQPKRGL